MANGGLVIRKVWRSEIGCVLLFLLLCIASGVLSRSVMPWTVIEGQLFFVGDKVVFLKLPLLWFIPFAVLLSGVTRIYNVLYMIDEVGIEARVGILSFNQSIMRVRFEDIRSIETDQTLMERALDVGDVDVGTAATGAVEVVLKGIACPREVRELIQAERDRRQKLAVKRAIRTGDEELISVNR